MNSFLQAAAVTSHYAEAETVAALQKCITWTWIFYSLSSLKPHQQHLQTTGSVCFQPLSAQVGGVYSSQVVLSVFVG